MGSVDPLRNPELGKAGGLMQNQIYDVLHSEPGGDEFQFEVVADTDALEVTINPIVADPVRFFNSDHAPFFKPGDNLLLQFIRLNLPYCFGQGTGIHHIGISWLAEDNEEQPITELAQNSLIDMACACDGIQLPGDGLFLQTPTKDGKLWGLGVTSLQFNVAMVNVPAVLVGQTLLATYFLGVSHTVPMEFGS